ncbi:MAG: hypothetical protein HC814_03245 [Rhodobacteraceae bacterium]|nr:hypothetical protein [Paracoccaceae bacterium]
MSAVPFLDLDFHFDRVLPFAKFVFGQTNYRVYVIDRRTGEHAVWFSAPRWDRPRSSCLDGSGGCHGTLRGIN